MISQSRKNEIDILFRKYYNIEYQSKCDSCINRYGSQKGHKCFDYDLDDFNNFTKSALDKIYREKLITNIEYVYYFLDHFEKNNFLLIQK